MSKRHLTPPRLPALGDDPAGVGDGDVWLGATAVRARVGGSSVSLEGAAGSGSATAWENGAYHVPGRWIIPNTGGLGTNEPYQMGTCVVTPVAFNESVTVTEVSPALVYTGSASAIGVLGVYNLDPATHVPTTPVVTWGQVTLTPSGGAPTLTLGTAHTFTAGVWGLACLHQGANSAQYFNSNANPYVSATTPTVVDAGGAYQMSGLATTGLTSLPDPYVFDGVTTRLAQRWSLRCAT